MAKADGSSADGSGLMVPVSKQDHIQGNPNAPVTLIEYGDFECPYCGAAHKQINALQRAAGDMMRFVFRHCPLTQVHPHAEPAARAAEAAGLQGKFWEMHDLLFENQKALEQENLLAYAEQLGCDLQRFMADVASPETVKRVRDDFMTGIRSGVNGTPTFFINGERFQGSGDYEQLWAAIKQAARKKQR